MCYFDISIELSKSMLTHSSVLSRITLYEMLNNENILSFPLPFSFYFVNLFKQLLHIKKYRQFQLNIIERKESIN